MSEVLLAFFTSFFGTYRGVSYMIYQYVNYMVGNSLTYNIWNDNCGEY